MAIAIIIFIYYIWGQVCSGCIKLLFMPLFLYKVVFEVNIILVILIQYNNNRCFEIFELLRLDHMRLDLMYSNENYELLNIKNNLYL